MTSIFNVKKTLCFYCLALIGTVVAGCVLKPVSDTKLPDETHWASIKIINNENVLWPDNELIGIFQQYWTFRKNGDVLKSFELESPHVQEMVMRGKYNGFFSKYKQDWSCIRVEKIRNITNQLIEIDFFVVLKTGDLNNKEIFYNDQWLLYLGKWVHVLKDPFLTGDGLGR